MPIPASSRPVIGLPLVAPLGAPQLWRRAGDFGPNPSANERLIEARRFDSTGTDKDCQSAGPAEAFLVALVGVGAPAALVFLVVLGFAGGTVPLLGWELPGGLVRGLTWMAALGLVPAALVAGALIRIGLPGVTARQIAPR